MNKYRFKNLPHQVDCDGNFDESCELTLSEQALHALESNALKLKIHKHGARTIISGLNIFIGSKSGEINLYVGNDNSSVTLGEGSSGSYHLRLWANSAVSIGKNTTSSSVRVVCDNSEFLCGEDCMFSDGILVQSADQHGIVDIKTGQIINTDYKSVVLGDHVWLGRHCTLTGNARVGNGSVIGTGAIVTGTIPDRVVAVGIPARVIKENHTWSRLPHELDAFSQRYVDENSR